MTGPGQGPGRDAHNSPSLARTVVITGALGLHARPAARFVKLASSFEATVEVTAKGITVSGRSIMGLMMLGAGDGTELTITAAGPDAEAALEALEALVVGGFEG